MTQIDIQSFLKNGAFLRTSDSKVSVWVSLEARPITKFEPTSIYIKEFFNTEAKELRSSHDFRMDESEFCSLLSSYVHKKHISLKLKACHKSLYETLFVEIMNRVHRGEIVKAVPIVFAETQNSMEASEKSLWLAQSILKAMSAPSRLWSFGIWSEFEGALGATPEYLFHQKGSEVESMALAGSCPRGDIEKRLPLIKDPKELREHQLVVDDIKNIFSKFGVVTTGPTEVIELPQIFHLKTILKAMAPNLNPLELVDRMHPTAALGVSPRNYGIQWLEALPEQKKRKFYGAPLLFPTPEGCITLVGIRTLQWDKEKFLLGAGGGLVKGSEMDQEWKEIVTKWKSTCELLGIELNEH